MTAYRQQALDCAAMLRAGLGKPRELRSVAPDAGGYFVAQCVWLVRADGTRHLPINASR